MNKDIVPELLEEIEKAFLSKSRESRILQDKLFALKNKKASYKDANEFAEELGKILAEIFKDKIKTEDLPDGKMFYNIAQRIVDPNMHLTFDMVGDYSRDVQALLNQEAGISIAALKADINQDRIDKIVEKVSSYDSYDDGKWLLDEPIVNFTQSIVDSTIRKNADFHYKLGFKPKIVRREVGGCCKWCKDKAGVYDYESVKNTGNDVFRRHRYCRCTVDYVPDKNRRQDVWSKEWNDGNKRIEVDNRIDKSKESYDTRISRIARAKAEELGYDPLPDDKVVNILRKDSEKWIQTLSNDEIKDISKYTFNGVDNDGKRLYYKINGYVEGYYNPNNDKEEETIKRIYKNIHSGILKNEHTKDIIVYRKDENPLNLEGVSNKFISSSVTKKGAFEGNPNVAIIVPKGSNGAYVENLSKYPKQREFLLNSGTRLERIYSEKDNYIYKVVIDNE